MQYPGGSIRMTLVVCPFMDIDRAGWSGKSSAVASSETERSHLPLYLKRRLKMGSITSHQFFENALYHLCVLCLTSANSIRAFLIAGKVLIC